MDGSINNGRISFMRNTFRNDEVLQVILYILQEMDGTCDTYKFYNILYSADNKHLAEWGRSITGDDYIAMDYGAVPSWIYDLFKAVRGKSYFSAYTDNIRETKFRFANNKDIVAIDKPDMDWLSKSEVDILDEFIAVYKDLDFPAIYKASRGYAWANTARNCIISLKDRLTELGANDDFINYVEQMHELESALCR